MRTFLFLFGLLFTLATSTATNKNQKEWHTKSYSVSDFSRIYIEGGYKVLLVQGDKNMLEVKASDDDVFDYLQVKSEPGKLLIDMEPDHFEFDRIILRITFKDLERLKIEGGVRLDTKGYLDLKELDLYVAGGATLDMELKADFLKITGEGGVVFDLEGVAEELDIKISGAGHVDAGQLKSKHVTFKVEGVGTGSVHASETLNAKIEGVGRIKYSGDPQVNKSIEGVGAVVKK